MAFFEYLKLNGTALPLPDMISVSFSVTAKWLKLLTAYSKEDKLVVEYFDTEVAERKSAEMYVEGFQAKLKKDTSYRGLWTVSFILKEF